MKTALCATLAALALAGCATTDALPPTVAPSPCVSVAAEPEPVGPVLTDAQQLAVDRAVIAALGPVLASAYVLYRDVTLPEWGRRAAASRDAVVASCVVR